MSPRPHQHYIIRANDIMYVFLPLSLSPFSFPSTPPLFATAPLFLPSIRSYRPYHKLHKRPPFLSLFDVRSLSFFDKFITHSFIAISTSLPSCTLRSYLLS